MKVGKKMKKSLIALGLVLAFSVSFISIDTLTSPQTANAKTFHGYDVASIQRHLNSFRAKRISNWFWWDDVAYKKLKVDGDYGPKTKSAVKEYQKKNGLHVDGIVGSKTWNKLSKERYLY